MDRQGGLPPSEGGRSEKGTHTGLWASNCNSRTIHEAQTVPPLVATATANAVARC
jgi:hypothetical protein